MRNTFLLLLIISGLSTWANTKNDELTPKSYPTKNTCSFTNNTTSNSDSITEAIVLRDYQYYEARYKKAHDRKVAGAILGILGAGTTIYAIKRISDNILDQEEVRKSEPFGIAGYLMFNMGVPLFVWGVTEQKNNKEAMEKYKQSKTSLHLAPTENGVGLVFTF